MKKLIFWALGCVSIAWAIAQVSPVQPQSNTHTASPGIYQQFDASVQQTKQEADEQSRQYADRLKRQADQSEQTTQAAPEITKQKPQTWQPPSPWSNPPARNPDSPATKEQNPLGGSVVNPQAMPTHPTVPNIFGNAAPPKPTETVPSSAYSNNVRNMNNPYTTNPQR